MSGGAGSTDAWLAAVAEEALDPALPICDAHHHLWDPPGAPDRRYLLDELLGDIAASRHNVVSTVFMECMAMYRESGPEALRPVGETRFADAVAESAQGRGVAVCAAIVGYADLRLGTEAGAVLDAHLATSDRFRGIRHATAHDSDPAIRNAHTRPCAGQLADAGFRRGLAEVTRRGLTFDAWLYHHQIPELTDLARAAPEQQIVFDHCGGPLGIGRHAGRRTAVFDQWRRDVRDLAQCENVVAKLGGLVMPINGFDYHKGASPPDSTMLAGTLSPWIEYMLEHFGVHRCLFESNFPVDRASCSYAVLWNAFKRVTANLSTDERRALFHDNAVALYRVET